MPLFIQGPRTMLDFDIDKYLNRLVPYNRLHLLPQSISWFLGHRDEPRQPIGSVLIWFWAFVGAVTGILVIEAVFMSPHLKHEGTPIVIASFGAAAILEYHTISSPLSQPRNAILGQFLSALIGVSITKLFRLSSHFESLRFVAGALSVGVASAAMGFTKTIHPPAGATALLCSTTPNIEALGWFLIPLMLLGSCLMVAVACVMNNVQRTFPEYWWTADDLRRDQEEGKEDIERAKSGQKNQQEEGKECEKAIIGDEDRIMIDGERIVVPEWLPLEGEEKDILEILRNRLRDKLGREGSKDSEMTKVDIDSARSPKV